MEPNQPNDEKQLRKRNAFTIINNVRDHCKQPPAARHLLLVLATYCNRGGVCWPSNDRLMHVTGLSRARVNYWLSWLKKAGDIQILKSGAGRNQRRKISVSRYITVLTPSDRKGIASETFKHIASETLNNHSEQPTLSTRGTHHLALRAANGAVSVSKYDAEEREKLKVFRGILSNKDPRWLPIDRYSDAVREALELVPNATAMKALCEAAAILVANGRDEDNFIWKPTGEKYECYLPKPNKGSAKRTLVRLIQCNRDNLPLCD